MKANLIKLLCVILALITFALMAIGSGSEGETSSKVGEDTEISEKTDDSKSEGESSKTQTTSQTEYKVGEDNDITICIRSTEYAANHQSDWKPSQAKYIYDETGLLIRKEWYNIENGGSKVLRSATNATYSYNNDGTVDHIDYISTSGSWSVYYFYDDQGQIIKTYQYGI